MIIKIEKYMDFKVKNPFIDFRSSRLVSINNIINFSKNNYDIITKMPDSDKNCFTHLLL